jgi:ABC-type Fe2+-enterobactin transport system substrate-binding protein
MAEFSDIKVVGLDEKASKPREPGSPMVRVVLTLSASAPAEWCNYFNDSWQGHIYMMKRHARASGNTIAIECVVDELESEHLPELKKVISETNTAYRRFHEQKQAHIAGLMAQEAADAAKLAELKKKLKFD